MDELVRALTSRYPNAVLQFEDFNMAHALPLLERYREHHLCFNDDVQVTFQSKPQYYQSSGNLPEFSEDIACSQSSQALHGYDECLYII